MHGRLHSFRHYFCSKCANDGVPEAVVMEWLGHRDSAMVRHYYHLYDAEAKRRMQTGGGNGDQFICPICRDMPAEDRPLYSQLNRELAHRMTCETLARHIRADTGLVADVIAAVHAEVDAAGRTDPAQVAELQRRKEKLSNQIQFLLQNAGESDEDRREAGLELRRLRGQRTDVEAALVQAERASRPPAVPTAEEVTAMLDDLANIIAAAAEGEPEDAGLARQLVEALTGGRIALEQQGERRRKGGWVRGRFRLRPLEYVCGRFGVAAPTGEGVEVVIDFRQPSTVAERGERVKALYDEGWSMTAICKQLALSPNQVRQAIAAWFHLRGLPVPDNRSRRNARPAPDACRPLYQRIADDVKRLLDQGLLIEEIAAQLGCDRATVTAAMKYWYASRGLTAPDGRARRKELRLAREAIPEGESPAEGAADNGEQPGGEVAPAA